MLTFIWKEWTLIAMLLVIISVYGNLEVVDTSLGKVWGEKKNSIIQYLGIPYAEAPTGKLRFRPTIPKRPWYPSIWVAKHFAPECLQSTVLVADDGTVRDENCLYLNIWRPISLDHSHPLPVLVWIYGGAFVHGGSAKKEYDGRHLAEKGAIVVSFNYRLGALGFLVSVNDGLFGNYGLEDQRVALEWIKTNIKMFGGDPNKITLFGESAGAMSIGLHFLHDTLNRGNNHNNKDINHRGAFHAIIMQSNPLGYKYRSITVANFLGEGFKEHLDCEDLSCLQSESVEELLHVQDSMMAIPRSIGDFFTWGPVLTDDAYYQEWRRRQSLISNISVSQPLETLQRLRLNNIPVLLGSNVHEGNLFVYGAYSTSMNKMVFQAVLYGFFREMTTKVLQTYSGLISQISKLNQPDYRTVLSQIIGDYLFRCPTQQFADQLHGLGFRVFLYEFALPTKIPNFEFCNGLSCHTCEIPYVFANKDLIHNQYAWQDTVVATLHSKDLHDDRTCPQNGFTIWLNTAFDSYFSLPSSYKKSKVIQQGPEDQLADLMSAFWVGFADQGAPNNVNEWWPPVKPKQLLSSIDTISINNVQVHFQGSFNNKFPLLIRKQLLHQMLFGPKSKVVLIENDCICDFWQSLNYRF